MRGLGGLQTAIVYKRKAIDCEFDGAAGCQCRGNTFRQERGSGSGEAVVVELSWRPAGNHRCMCSLASIGCGSGADKCLSGKIDKYDEHVP